MSKWNSDWPLLLVNFQYLLVNLLLCSFHIVLELSKYIFNPSFSKIIIHDRKLHQITQALQREIMASRWICLPTPYFSVCGNLKAQGMLQTHYFPKIIGAHLKIIPGSNRNFKHIFSSRKRTSKSKGTILFCRFLQ